MKYFTLAPFLIGFSYAQNAGQCGDILDDPWVDLEGPGTRRNGDTDDTFRGLQFEGYCGDVSTPGTGFATGKNDEAAGANGAKTNTVYTVCRVQCKNWDTVSDESGKESASLVWVRTKKKWFQTKYLQCHCSTNNNDVEKCRYKRRGYNPRTEGLRGYDGGEKENAMLVSCEPPTCIHPDSIDMFNTGTIPELYDGQGQNKVCDDCKMNTGRGGTWACFNNDDSPIDAGAGVPKGGYCKLTCPEQDLLNQNKVIRCQYPHNLDPLYQYKHLWRVYKFLDSNRYRKLLGNDVGWQCTNEHHDDNIDSDVKVILNAIYNKQNQRPNAGKGPGAVQATMAPMQGNPSVAFTGSYASLEFDRTIMQVDWTGNFRLSFKYRNIQKLDNEWCGIFHGVDDEMTTDKNRAMFPALLFQKRADNDYNLYVKRSACERSDPNVKLPVEQKMFNVAGLTAGDEIDMEIQILNNEITFTERKQNGDKVMTKQLSSDSACATPKRGVLLKASSQFYTNCGGEISDVEYGILCPDGEILNETTLACE